MVATMVTTIFNQPANEKKNLFDQLMFIRLTFSLNSEFKMSFFQFSIEIATNINWA